MSGAAVAGLSSVEAAVEAFARGQMVVVVDDPDRENEGDLVMAAEFATPDAVNFMAIHGRGLICTPLLPERLEELGIPPMVARNTDPRHTAFHVSVDHRNRTSTGISAPDRSATIRALADPSSGASEFSQPGHVFPLAYRSGGVLERAGHTEAAVDLTRLAGLCPAAVICEIADADGQMMRLPGLLRFAERHGFPVLAISHLIEYLARSQTLVARVSHARMPLEGAEFTMVGYRDLVGGHEHVAAVLGDIEGRPGVLVRMHSECLTGDVFRSQRCDCGRQLDLALARIAAAGAGVVVYMRGHEGRGIGLLEKLSAYGLQDGGLDTVEANIALGHAPDHRTYGVGAAILRDLEVDGVRLLTNNPAKQAGLEECGIVVKECVPLTTIPTIENVRYLRTKRTKLGHFTNVAPSTLASDSC